MPSLDDRVHREIMRFIRDKGPKTRDQISDEIYRKFPSIESYERDRMISEAIDDGIIKQPSYFCLSPEGHKRAKRLK